MKKLARKRRTTTPRIKPKTVKVINGKGPRRKIIVTLSPNGAPRRRADITWPANKMFTLENLANHKDCRRWPLLAGWHIRIMKGE